MKKLILVRHAKSSWEFPCDDKDRPLLSRGVDRANTVAHKTHGFVGSNYYITSSPAVRALETAKIFLSCWDIPISNCIVVPSLYTFNVAQLEEIVKSYPNHQKNAILFGHNDAITEFVNKFGDVNILNVPTAGFVEIVFESNDWKSIKKGKTTAVVFPKQV